MRPVFLIILRLFSYLAAYQLDVLRCRNRNLPLLCYDEIGWFVSKTMPRT